MEGPIKKDTASFIFSARRTYIDILARPLIKSQTDGVSAGYYFYDLNGKLNWKLGARDRLYLSGYTGYDEFYADDKTQSNGSSDTYTDHDALGWGNRTAALRWNHILNDRLFLNTHFTYTRYQFDVGITQQHEFNKNGQAETTLNTLKYLSNIQDLSLKTDFDFLPNPDHYIRFGGQYIRHQFRPGALQTTGSTDPAQNQDLGRRIYADEASLFAEDDYKVSDRLKVNAGLRLNSFRVDNKLYPFAGAAPGCPLSTQRRLVAESGLRPHYPVRAPAHQQQRGAAHRPVGAGHRQGSSPASAADQPGRGPATCASKTRISSSAWRPITSPCGI